MSKRLWILILVAVVMTLVVAACQRSSPTSPGVSEPTVSNSGPLNKKPENPGGGGGGKSEEDTFTVAVTIGGVASDVFEGIGSDGKLNEAPGFPLNIDLSAAGIEPPCNTDFDQFSGLFVLETLGTSGNFTPWLSIQYFGIGVGEGGPRAGYGFTFGPGQTASWDDTDCGLPTAGSSCSENTVSGSEVKINVKKSNKSGCETMVFPTDWDIVVERTSNL